MEARRPDADDTLTTAAPGLIIDAASFDAPLLGGRYHLLALIGSGGAGQVYRVRDQQLDEIVALKMLRHEVGDAGAAEALRQEVKLARRVTHKNVARTFDIGEHNGVGFLTMEYVDGISLARVIGDVPLSTQRALHVAQSIAEGLAAAHEAGVIHRDLKPSNVLVESANRVVITDFGIARLGTSASPHESAAWIGTPAYMAPEQVECRTDIDARTDIYALGEVLFELLTGRRVWLGTTSVAVAMRRLNEPPPNPCELRADLPRAVGDFVVHLLARHREDRIATAEEVVHALTALAALSDVRELASSDSRDLRASSAEASDGAQAPTSLQPRAKSIPVAVLPFRNGAPADDYISDGFSEDLLDLLSTAPALRVRPRSLVQAFKRQDVDPREVGRQLGVDVVVDGSMRRLGDDSFRLTVRLVGVADGFQLWARTFEAVTADLFVVSDTAARAIGHALTTHIVGPTRKTASDPVAIDLYLRAREELAKRAYGNDVDDAVELLQEALRRDPEEPNILAAYAIARSRISHSRKSALEALRAAELATRIAPHLADGWLSLASVRLMEADFPSTVRASARALQCSPHLAKAHHLVGDVMVQVGWTEAAIERCALALRLDPSLPGPAITLALVHALFGDDESAEEMLRHPSLSGAPVSVIAMGTRSRFAMWRRKPPLPADGDVDISSQRGPAARIARFCQEVAVSQRVSNASVESLRSLRSLASTLIGSFVGQIEAEAWASVAEGERALDAIEFASSRGLSDLLWMDRLVLFSEIRTLPRFQALRASVVARAETIRAALLEEGFSESVRLR